MHLNRHLEYKPKSTRPFLIRWDRCTNALLGLIISPYIWWGTSSPW